MRGGGVEIEEPEAVHQGAGVSGVGCGGQAAPDAGLLQGQAQAGQSPLEVHAQGNLVLGSARHRRLLQKRSRSALAQAPQRP